DARVSPVPRRDVAHRRDVASDRVRALHADPDPGPPRRRPLARVLGRGAFARRSWAARAWLAAVAGVGFVLAFVTIETAWMRWVVGRPWSTERVPAAPPRVLVTGALSARVRWVPGGSLPGVGSPGGLVTALGRGGRARAAATAPL